MHGVVVLKCVWVKSGRNYMFVLTSSPSWKTSVSSASMVKYCRRWSLRTSKTQLRSAYLVERTKPSCARRAWKDVSEQPMLWGTLYRSDPLRGPLG